ncbi:hypothetical protein [Vibrio phage VP5]|uniref:Internal virion protein n=1 Tax=Vibrio phage VP5 TaxID=260827 RepID=Q6R6B1_9CAUD|nr:virion structural protein [Vibrio phage VP5]AAR92068.1 hypothetical protein [Vibrio phage VP5]
MPRKCFEGWKEEDIAKMFGKTDTDLITAEDIADAIKGKKQEKIAVYKQAEAIKKGNEVLTQSKDPASALLGMLSRDPNEEVKFLSADQRINAIRAVSKAKISDFMADLAPTTRQIFAGIATGERRLTKSQQRLLDDFVHELYGRQTGNADALKAAKGWKKATEDLNARFGQAGGHMAELDDWRLPQKHNRMAISKAGADVWVEKVWDLIDRDKMVKKLRKGKDEDNLREALYSVYNNIVTDGMSSSKTLSKKFTDMMRSERFITFKDSDSWLKYQREFGDTNVYASMLGHIDNMSRAIGMMETFGPDPDIGFNTLERAVKTKKGLTSRQPTGARPTFDMLMGYNMVEEQTVWGNRVAGLRNLWTASKLGAAVVSALTDSVYASMAASYNAMSPARVLRRMLSEVMKPSKSEASRKLWAQDFGFGAEFALDRMAMTSDYTQSFGGHRSRNLAEAVMVVSGMNQWTQSARASFQFEFATALTRAADSKWSDLPEKMRNSMGRYGITESDWAAIAAAPRTNYKGNKMIDPRNMDAELQTKLVGMVDGETMMAVPTPDARTRAFMAGGTKSGNFGGELHRSLFMFHSFPITTIMNQWRRVFTGKGYSGAFDRMSAAAIMVGATSVLGVGIIQAKDILNGKKPRSMSDPKLWIEGMAQGGSFNYIGDLMRNAASGYSHDMTSYVGGPVLAYGDWVAMTAADMAKGDAESAMARTANFATQQIPFNNLWYTKIATDRLLMDRIRRLSDPEYDKKQLNKMRKMQRTSQQEYWWSPPIGGQSNIESPFEE